MWLKFGITSKILWMSKMIFSTFNGNHERAKTITIETSSAWVLDCFLIFSLKRLFWISSTLWSRATGMCVPVVVGFEFDNTGSWKIGYWYFLLKSNYPNYKIQVTLNFLTLTNKKTENGLYRVVHSNLPLPSSMHSACY